MHVGNRIVHAMKGIILKYRLWQPLQALRTLYYNFMKVKSRQCHSFLIPSPYAVFDLDKTSKIHLTSIVVFGWCNMSKSRMETSLWMGRNAQVTWGGKNNGQISVGCGSYIQVGNNATLHIGNSFINREVKIICNKSITIGDGCIIAMGTVIRDNDGGDHKILADGYVNAKPVVIGNHVWLGENVMVLKGVTIGEGAIVAAASLVTKDVPPHTLVAGSPARVIRENVEWEA